MRITENREVKKFRSLATVFCKLVRHPKSVKTAKFLSQLEKLLPLLCYSVQSLPQVEPCPNYLGKKSHKTWQRLSVKLRGYLSKYDSYCRVYEPYDPNDTEPTIGSLSDDLADICIDLSPGLTAWRYSGTVKRRAIVDNWQRMYRIHWGEHAASAWKAVYCLVNDHEAGTKDETFKGHRIRR